MGGVAARAVEHGVGGVGGGRLETLTTLRFVAAFAVFGNHIGDAFLPPDSPLNRVLASGSTGVSFFFVLSGFVLTWAWRPDDRAVRFYRRRVARVMPNHLVAWLVAFVLAAAIGRTVATTGLFGSLALLQAWHPSPAVHFAVNPVAWTLSVEAVFYLTFPAVIGPLGRLTRRGRHVAMAICVGATVCWAIVGQMVDPDARHWVVYVFPLARLPEFILGILLALGLHEFRRVPLGPVLVAAVGAWTLSLALPPAFGVATVTVVAFALIIVAAAQSDLRPRGGSWLRAWPLVTLGRWSFAFYLVHELIIRSADTQIDLDRLGGVLAIGAVVGLLAASVAASGLLARLVERPCEARLRGQARAPAVRVGPTELPAPAARPASHDG